LPDITANTTKLNNEEISSHHSNPIKISRSIENILHDSNVTPPPKKPSRSIIHNVPPLPPKKSTNDSVDNVFSLSSKYPDEKHMKNVEWFCDKNSSIENMKSILNNLNIESCDSEGEICAENIKKIIEDNYYDKSSYIEHRTSNESGFMSITSQNTTTRHQKTIEEQLSFAQDIADDQKITNFPVISFRHQEREVAERTISTNTSGALSSIPPPLPVELHFIFL
jgi:hypothetical protein